MYAILLYTTLVWGPIGNALYAPDSVLPLTPAACQAIRHTLRAKDRPYVVLDAQDRVDRAAINRHTSKSPNFQALKTLINDTLVVEVTIGNDYLYRDTHDSIRHGSLVAVYTNELTDATQYMLQYTVAQLKNMGFRDEIRASGPSGITLLPGGEQDVEGDGKGSVNGHIVVVLSSDLTERDAARKLAHEAYGHALFFMLRKDPNHAEDKARGGNQALEDQIQRSIEETERNYDDATPSCPKKIKRGH
ncbi:hypothetical protein KK062_24270 [Fulvivirgaceae bacterium PWU5]|uniref:Uncharacterized protein n=1 Tax=Dawidia cretensis TaxID=2782350 RepID=A0AAP2E1H4_9BACT|nr:hypothetical protein [Dawidia cretensis]MBT1711380.1 hypothetical protein [Dawidia cretensis]